MANSMSASRPAARYSPLACGKKIGARRVNSLFVVQRREFTRLAPIFLLLIVFGCQRHPMPERGGWSGTIELPGGKALPFRMELDLSGGKPAGFFINGDEKTSIPEIFRNGDNLAFTFSEYGERE